MIKYVLLSQGYLIKSCVTPNEIFKNPNLFNEWDETVGLITDDLDLDFPNTVKERHMMDRFEKLDNFLKKSIIDRTLELFIKNDCYKDIIKFYKNPFDNTYSLRGIFYGIFQIDNISDEIIYEARMFGARRDRSLVEKKFDMGFKDRSDKKIFRVFKCSTDLNFYVPKDKLSEKFLDNFHCLNLKNKEKIVRLINATYKKVIGNVKI